MYTHIYNMHIYIHTYPAGSSRTRIGIEAATYHSLMTVDFYRGGDADLIFEFIAIFLVSGVLH
jgi:hypothetical protein